MAQPMTTAWLQGSGTINILLYTKDTVTVDLHTNMVILFQDFYSLHIR